MEKKDRNKKVLEIYVDQTNYDIVETVKIIEKLPELASQFTGKDIRKSCMGILQSMQVWRKLDRPANVKGKNDLTKKNLVGIFCKALEIEVADVPTLLNLKKVEVARLIIAMSFYNPEIEQISEVQSFINKQEKE